MLKKSFVLFCRIIMASLISFYLFMISLVVYRKIAYELCFYNLSPSSYKKSTTTHTAPDGGKDSMMSVAKPLIYLYPNAESEVSIKLGNSHKISHSYPKYENEWVVRAKPNGDLTYNNRTYYGLYWEGKNAPKFELDEGFVVKGSDTITFLEEKLAILGLNEREANEFIIYWLPRLENNTYNFIKFASFNVQNEYMPLEINPKPNTLIRVMMVYKKLDNPIEVREQVLAPTPIRNGFTVVEWGGTEINSDKVY